MKRLSPQVGNVVMVSSSFVFYLLFFINRFVVSFLSDWVIFGIFVIALLVSSFFIEYEKRDREAGWDILYTVGLGFSMVSFLFLIKTTIPWVALIAIGIGTIGIVLVSYPTQRFRIKKLRKLEFFATFILYYIIFWYTPTWVEWIDAMVTK